MFLSTKSRVCGEGNFVLGYDGRMKKRGVLFTLSLAGLLLACGQEGSSSSLSSSSSSSLSTAELPTYGRMNLNGEASIDFDILIQDVVTNVNLDIYGISLKIKTDTEVERLGDILDYTYYRVSNIIGELTAESIRMSIKRGRATILYDFDTANIDFYLLEGNFYVDLSGLDFTDIDWSSLGIGDFEMPNGKIFIKDAVSFLNDEQFRTLADVLSLGVLSMDTLLNFAQKDPVIDNALTMERYDSERFMVRYALTSDSIAALVGQFSSESAAEVKTAIEGAIAFVPDTFVSLLYDVKTQQISNLGVSGGIMPNLAALSEKAAESIKEFTLAIDAFLFTDQVTEFVIPPLEDYQECKLPQKQEQEGE